MMYLTAGIGVVVLAQTFALFRMAIRLRRLPQIDERLSNFANALTLLTDTTETCFQALGNQIVDAGAKPAPAARAARQRRVVSAAQRGRSIGDIAVSEDVAESEVRLRLSLHEEKTTRDARKEKPCQAATTSH
jgi:hypothetical protein